MDKSTSNKKNVVDHSTLDVKGNLHIGDVTYIINEKTVTIPHLLTNNIPSNGGRILGRDKELATIATHLAHNRPTVLVNGIGGIGKTSVATKYVATFGHEYKHLAWLTVQSSLVEAFTNDIVLLKSLHIEQDVRQLIENQRLTDAFKLVVHQLNTLENTLVVLDNANDVADLMDNKNLFDTAKCHYLITSRTQPQEWTIVPIDVLSEDEAVGLFRRIAPSVSATDEALKSLLSKLFYHTLLIELVAKAVENAGFSFEELQKMVETQFIHDENLNEDTVPTGKHGDNYEAKRAKIEKYIWLIFSNVKDLGDDYKQILRGMALLPVATPFDREFLKTHLALFGVKDIVPNLSLLVEWGWLEKEQNKWFKMHPLIADVVVKHLKVNANIANEYIDYVINLIHFNYTDPEHNIFIKNSYKPLANRLIDLFYNENSAIIASLLDRLSHLEQNFGLYDKAVYYKKQAFQIALYVFDENSSKTASIAANLGTLYGHLGKYNDAVSLLELSLEIDLKNYDSMHREITTKQSNLSNAYFKLGNYERAVILAETALESNIKTFGSEHPEVALTQSNLANIYGALGKNELAANLLECALGITLKKFDATHPSIAINQNNLAIVYKKIGKIDKAKVLWQLAYQNFLKNFGEEHPRTIEFKKRVDM